MQVYMRFTGKNISSISCGLVKKHVLVPHKQLAKDIKWRLNAANLIPAGFKAMKARSNLVSLQSIWLGIEYEQLDESGINIDVSEAKTQRATSDKTAIIFATHCTSSAADILWEASHHVVCQTQKAWLRAPSKRGKPSYRRTCSSPGVTVPGRITPAPVPLKVPSWTWKTGLRARPEDCSRVFSTSRGQVTIAPTVPLHLQIDDMQKKK